MYCPNCGSYLSFQKSKCDRCNEDVKIYKRIVSVSSEYYNDGLQKAKLRDLSGAAQSLNKSLKIEKRNTNARNLLGLVYYEMGETVSALSQWVISRHFQSTDNDADQYIDEIQANPSRLETINQTIKKFNAALALAKQGNGDLAIIQLKKVVSMNPRFLRALQLLALLYIKNGQADKAFRCLCKAKKIDISNTTTLRYLKEIEGTEAERADVPDPVDVTGNVGVTGHDGVTGHGDIPVRERKRHREEPAYVPVSPYKEDKPNIFLFLNLIFGVAVGMAVLYFLIVPTIEKKLEAQYRSNVVDYSQELSDKDTSINTLENDNNNLQEKIESLTKENENLSKLVADKTLYDGLFKAARIYTQGESREAADLLITVDEKQLERPEAKKLYTQLKDKTFAAASKSFYDEGHTLYSGGKYKESIVLFEKALETKEDNVDAIYFMGRAYERLSDKENAAIYYQRIVNDYPDSKRASDAKQKLRYIS